MGRYSKEALAKRRDRNLLKWLDASKKKCGGGFGYSKVSKTFRNQKSPPVQIYCRRHRHWFWVIPYNHLRYPSGGCSRCEYALRVRRVSENKKKEFENWVKKKKAPHLKILGLFEAMTKPIKVRCELHNRIQEVLPTNLVHNGNLGCIECAYISSGKKSRVDEDKIKGILAGRLPDHISYQGSFFSNAARSTRIKIKCDFHGKKTLTIADAKRTRLFCKDCAALTVGYADYRLKKLIDEGSRGRPTIFALMEIEALGLTALKVGITTRSLEQRYRHHLRAIFFEQTLDEIDALVLEARIKRSFKDCADLRILKKGMRCGKRWSGDTELYLWRVKESILIEITKQIESIKKRKPNYPHELKRIEDQVPKISIGRAKDLSNLPVPVVGINPVTNKVIHRFESFSAARRAGFKNISLIVNEKGRQFAGGLRWFKEEDFSENQIPKIKFSGNGKPVICNDTGELFHSGAAASKNLAERGLILGANAITRAARGERRTAGGFSWSFSDLSHEEIDLLDKPSEVGDRFRG